MDLDLTHDVPGPSHLAFSLDLTLPPLKDPEQSPRREKSYPYSEDSSQGKQYMNTRCPAWCDRILMSPSARELVLKPENEEKSIVYDNIGPNVCMGDHKPVFLDVVGSLAKGGRTYFVKRLLLTSCSCPDTSFIREHPAPSLSINHSVRCGRAPEGPAPDKTHIADLTVAMQPPFPREERSRTADDSFPRHSLLCQNSN
ncbi:unnamed protein product [Pleuronectes platessa]|uniref:Uncharacterized protein n=1 Tax=Pleuronectes platessa TaxID=8262 RepID=A0A9N7V6P0_PLEPL|nr:unnamed protein product [Pleuronectes platessa]